MYTTGINPDNVRTSSEGPEVGLGQIGFNSTKNGVKGFIYVKDSGSGITAGGYAASINGSNFTAAMSTTANSAPGTGTGKLVGFSVSAIPADGFGWLQLFGQASVRVSASAAAHTLLNSTSTSGQIDDDATAGSRRIDGVVLTTANAASPGFAPGFLNWPSVGATL